MANQGESSMRLKFLIPARGLMGYRSELLTDTRGNGVMSHVFHDYEPYKGAIEERKTGSLVAHETGDTSSYGLFNTVLKWFGVAPIRWLDDGNYAMNVIVIMNVWKSIGYYALIILSALKAIPLEIYEAARLDNASPIKTFFKITLPMLSPQLFMLLITITTSSFKVFDSVRIMTGGGPGRSTTVLCMYIYDYAFQRNNSLGLGAAAGVVLMVILMLITLIDFHGLERKVHYQ